VIKGLYSTIGFKEEGAELQNVELKVRERRFSSPEVVQLKGRSFLCLTSGSENVAIMLNPEFPPYYKQLPSSTSFSISESEFHALRESRVATRTVLNVLESHVDNSSGVQK